MSSSSPTFRRRWAGCGIVCLLVAAGLTSTAAAVVTNVTQGTVHETIQDAIDNAVDGDEIVADDDVYMEYVDFLGKAITVRSANGPVACIVEDPVAFSNTGFTFQTGEGRSSVLQGFTIRFFKRAVDCVSSSPSILDCVIDQNKDQDEGAFGAFGAGVRVTGGAPLLSGCTLSFNEAGVPGCPGFGGGIALENSTAELVDCVINNNIAWDHQAEVGDGGGLHVSGGEVTFTGCVFAGNRAAYGGGATVSAADATFTGCVFDDNTSVGIFSRGGGLWNIHGTVQVIDCTFTLNDAIWGGVGGAIANSGGDATVTGSEFRDNRAMQPIPNGISGVGGALFSVAGGVDPATLTITDCRFILNEAEVEGGALYNSDAGFGAEATIADTLLCGNTPQALAGGGPIMLLGGNHFTDGFGIVDLVALLAVWGHSGALDLDGNGVVGIGDLILLLANWGGCV